MTIDFHSEQNRGTYATRSADTTWKRVMLDLVDPLGLRVVDIGCGGGIYARAWSDLGAAGVTGVDFSARMVEDASVASIAYATLAFVQGDATATGLPGASVDIAFSRAVIHHLPELGPAFAEMYRILAPGGIAIVQDRTIEDVTQPASPEHLRGYLFDAFPRLLDVERERRPVTREVAAALAGAGFVSIATTPIQETRRTYATPEELRDDLLARTGRSILHALSDEELNRLVEHIAGEVPGHFPLEERDRWTVWSATKPAS